MTGFLEAIVGVGFFAGRCGVGASVEAKLLAQVRSQMEIWERGWGGIWERGGGWGFGSVAFFALWLRTNYLSNLGLAYF